MSQSRQTYVQQKLQRGGRACVNVAWLPKICVLTFVTLLDYLEFPYKEEIIIHILSRITGIVTYICPLISVGQLVGLSVKISLKGGKLHFHALTLIRQMRGLQADSRKSIFSPHFSQWRKKRNIFRTPWSGRALTTFCNYMHDDCKSRPTLNSLSPPLNRGQRNASPQLHTAKSPGATYMRSF